VSVTGQSQSWSRYHCCTVGCNPSATEL